jgi:hypothetical protein
MAKSKKPVDVSKYYNPDSVIVEDPDCVQKFKDAFEADRRARDEIGPKKSPKKREGGPITHPPEPTHLEKVFRQLEQKGENSDGKEKE